MSYFLCLIFNELNRYDKIVSPKYDILSLYIRVSVYFFERSSARIKKGWST